GMSVIDILMNSVGVGARDDVHAQAAAAFHHLAEWIAVPQPFAAVVHGDPGGIERDASTGAKTSAIDMTAPEVIEPEVGIVVAGIVLYKSHLRPAHGTVIPAGLRMRNAFRTGAQ